MTLFETIGETKVRAIIDGFVEEMVADSMIGFFFRGVDVPRLKQREFQFTAKFLGADMKYEGRPMGRVHQRHAIMGGQFDRRRQILKEHMDRQDVAPEAAAQWLAHVDQLRSTITRDGRGECTRPDLPLTAGTRFRMLDA